jgi:hypothetical protein
MIQRYAECFWLFSRFVAGRQFECASGVRYGFQLGVYSGVVCEVCLFAGVTVTGKWVCESVSLDGPRSAAG